SNPSRPATGFGGPAGGAPFLPDLSHAARPPYRVNAMPLRVLPSNPTAEAGTSSFTQPPPAGNPPIYFRDAVPPTPHPSLFAPQYARCSQEPSFHCSIISSGMFAGSRYAHV